MKANDKDGKKLIYLLGFIGLMSLVYYAIYTVGANQFENNKTFTQATVKNFVKEKSNSDFSSYTRYLVKYEFTDQNKNFTKIVELRIEEYKDYFETKPEYGDEITIVYNKLNPEDSRLVEKEELKKNRFEK